MARRLVERGVRFVQIYSGGMENERSWDGHADIEGNHGSSPARRISPSAAWLTDLARARAARLDAGDLGGEFGRLPIAAERRDTRPRPQPARLHHLAGRRRRPRAASHYGATDEIGYKAVSRPRHVNDLHATILHLLGLITRS